MEIGIVGTAIVLFFAAWIVASLWIKRRATGLQPYRALQSGQQLRLRAEGGVMRTRLAMASPQSFFVHAPVSRDRFVELDIGEWVTVEAAVANGAMLFRSLVIGNDKSVNLLELSTPEWSSIIDRRLSNRQRPAEPVSATLDGQPALLIDYAEGGARIECPGRYSKGDRVHICVRGSEAIHAGWVVAAEGGADSGDTCVYRLIFEEPFRPGFSKS